MAASDPAQPIIPLRPHHRTSAIHRALLTGLLGTVGSRIEDRRRQDAGEFAGPRGLRFQIAPGSALHKKAALWVMAAEIVQTHRFFARIVAKTHTDWIEKAAAHLVQRSYLEPHWLKDAGQVAAFEKVTLQGLVLVPRRRVPFGPIDPKAARDIFIQSALVEGELRTSGSFLSRNRALLSHLGELESRVRRRNLRPDATVISAFYEARIPADVHSTPAFEKFRRRLERENPDGLIMTLSDLMATEAAQVTRDDYPDVVNLGDVEAPIVYRFEPGHPDDGITATVPVEALPRIRSDRAEWLVPGYRRELVTAMLRALPKRFRAPLTPIGDTAEACLRSLQATSESPRVALSRIIHRLAGVSIDPADWTMESLPDHLSLNYHVIDQSGELVASGRNLGQLVQLFAGSAGAHQPAAIGQPLPSPLEQRGLIGWTFGDLPETVSIARAGATFLAWPAIADDGESVSIKLVDSHEAAVSISRRGVRRLFTLQMRGEIDHLIDYMPDLDSMAYRFAPLGTGGELRQALRDLVADRAFLNFEGEIRSNSEFEKRLNAGWGRLYLAAEEARQLVDAILDAWQDVALLLATNPPPMMAPTYADVRRQVANLVPSGFLIETPFAWLRHLPRFLRGASVRLRKLASGSLEREQRLLPELTQREEKRQAACDVARNSADAVARLQEFRWLLEEYRISLFAQHLRTSQPVSAKRIDDAWKLVEQEIRPFSSNSAGAR